MPGRGARDLGPEAWRESPFGYLAGVCRATGSCGRRDEVFPVRTGADASVGDRPVAGSVIDPIACPEATSKTEALPPDFTSTARPVTETA